MDQKHIKSFGANHQVRLDLKAGCIAFNAGCNEVFSKPCKKSAQIRLVVFEKKANNAPLIPKNDAIEPKARMLSYSIYQLKSCQQVKGQLQAFGKHGLR